AFIIGVAQALAVIPGLSRSGATISAGLLSGVSRQEVAKFSFLMVVIPILGESFLNIVGGELGEASNSVGLLPLLAGFATAFIVGFFAAKLVLELVRRSKMWPFALYCAVVGIISLLVQYGAL
ncbi:MAG: undecaprenyl-diphosphate phosphatase, partial [Bacteroidales bacterium]